MRNGNNNFNWSPDRWQGINKVAHDESANIRVLRNALPLWGNSGGYVDSIVGHEVTLGTLGKPLSIKAGQKVVPVELSVEFQLSPEQFHDEQVTEALTTRASYFLALAEDKVILEGNRAREFLTSLNVIERNLDEQRGLFKENQPQVQRPILESILNAMRRLQERNHHGKYCVLVAPDLYEEAFRPRQNTLDAPIYEIRPLVDCFLYSPAAPEKTGVMWSSGGHTLDIAVPVDVMVEFTDEEKGVALLRTVEQFALRINDGTAIEALV
jgi:uncharacterized linocin/CFP29 family protein